LESSPRGSQFAPFGARRVLPFEFQLQFIHRHSDPSRILLDAQRVALVFSVAGVHQAALVDVLVYSLPYVVRITTLPWSAYVAGKYGIPQPGCYLVVLPRKARIAKRCVGARTLVACERRRGFMFNASHIGSRSGDARQIHAVGCISVTPQGPASAWGLHRSALHYGQFPGPSNKRSRGRSSLGNTRE
jgi:hypothetical protein